MKLPLWVRAPELVQTVESVALVESERPERSDDRSANAGTAEQPRRVELTGSRAHVADIVEELQVELLVHAEAQLDQSRVERIAE